MNKIKSTFVAAALLGAGTFAFVGCQSNGNHTHSNHAHGSAAAKPYPLDNCLVTDENLDDQPYTLVHQGQEVKLCCKGCLEDFKKEPAKYLSKLNSTK